MATVKDVEGRIREIEGFAAQIYYPNGRDVRGDRKELRQYPYKRALKNSKSVARWKEERFKSTYPDFEVEVLDPQKKKVHGRTKLSTVRDKYLDE